MENSGRIGFNERAKNDMLTYIIFICPVTSAPFTSRFPKNSGQWVRHVKYVSKHAFAFSTLLWHAYKKITASNSKIQTKTNTQMWEICYGHDLCEADKLCEDLWFFQKLFKFYQFIADLDVNFDSTIQFKSLNMNKRRTFCTIRFGADLRVCKQHMVMQVKQKWNINVNELKKRCYNFCKWLQTENESQSQRMYRC